jgi:phosphoribosylglycinamide formyltransferase-1
MLKSLVILASGNGSLAQAIIDSSDAIGARVIAVVSDNPTAHALERAKKAGIPTQIVEMKADRKAWDTDLIALLRLLEADLVVSAGFMRILSKECVSEFKFINSHPALLPLYPGAHAVRDALLAGATHTGSTIHWVDSGVDTGQIIAQERVEIIPGDTEDSLHERIKIVERRLYVETLKKLLPTLESADV